MGKNLDAELAAAAGIDEDDAPEADSMDEGAEGVGDDGSSDELDGVADARRGDGWRRDGGSKASWGLLGALVLIAGGLVCLFMFGFKEASVWDMPLSQFMASMSEHEGKRVRISGELVPGTLTKRDRPCEYRFMVRDLEDKKTQHLEVRFPQCILPDSFRDRPEGGVIVTAEGTLKDGHFEASHMMAKCSSKYDPKTHSLSGKETAANEQPEGEGLGETKQ